MKALITLCMLALCAGCATKPMKIAIPTPTTKRLGDYGSCFLMSATIDPNYSDQSAVDIFDNELRSKMNYILGTLKPSESTVSAQETGEVLVIKPHILEVKFIGRAARFWAGVMAGSSVMTVQVTYQDAANGNVLGNPTFQSVGDAWLGAQTRGATDYMIIDQIIDDIALYTAANR